MKIKDLTQGVAEGTKQEILFYAKLPDGPKVYARVKDAEQLGDLQQQYRGAEIKTFDYNRPDVIKWLESRRINLRKFVPGMVQTMYEGVAEDASTAMSNVADRLANKDDGQIAKLRAAGDKRREEQLKGRVIAGRDTSSKDAWGNLKVDEAHPNSKIYDKCWTGYKKVPGKKRGEAGSCKEV